jgi:predicted DNA-binding transcriptional regulator AlpA
MGESELVAKLDELIAITRAASTRANAQWLDAAAAAELLCVTPRQFAERIACKPGFPHPLRVGNPRWKRAEVLEWADKTRDASVRKRAA